MKKFIKFFVIFLLGILLILLIAIPFVNNQSAATVERDLLSLPLPNHTELVDSISRAGKLVGNGNGMQYFGALLIKSELPEDELKLYYGQYRENDCIVERQKDDRIAVIEHGELSFTANLDDDPYYIVYSWGNSDDFLSSLDIRGH